MGQFYVLTLDVGKATPGLEGDPTPEIGFGRISLTKSLFPPSVHTLTFPSTRQTRFVRRQV